MKCVRDGTGRKAGEAEEKRRDPKKGGNATVNGRGIGTERTGYWQARRGTRLSTRGALSKCGVDMYIEAGRVDTPEVTVEHVLEVIQAIMLSADRMVAAQRDHKTKASAITVSHSGCDNSVVLVEDAIDVSRAKPKIDLGVIL